MPILNILRRTGALQIAYALAVMIGVGCSSEDPPSPTGAELDVARYDLKGDYDWVRGRLVATVDITLAPPVVQGEPGGSPEIHEKINPANGRGVVVLFANASGRYRYVTERAADRASWQTGGPLQIRYDARGRAVIDAEFTGPGARIVFFGAR